jgi:hypothetical protein
MRSIGQILCGVIDSEINTPEQGAALLAEESREYAAALKITEDEARAVLLHNLEYGAGLCPGSDAEKVRTVFSMKARRIEWVE